MSNCLFLRTGTCDFGFADTNCDRNLTSANTVNELNAVFFGHLFSLPISNKGGFAPALRITPLSLT